MPQIAALSCFSLALNASSDLLLQELVLLWSDLFQDVRHHFLEALCLLLRCLLLNDLFYFFDFILVLLGSCSQLYYLSGVC